MLVIVNLSSKAPIFPMETLSEIDSALAPAGLKKQVRSSSVPEKEFSVAYDGTTIAKKQVEDIVSIIFCIEVEESVSFP